MRLFTATSQKTDRGMVIPGPQCERIIPVPCREMLIPGPDRDSVIPGSAPAGGVFSRPLLPGALPERFRRPQ